MNKADKYSEFNEFLSNIPQQKLKEISDKDRERAEKDFREFKTALKRGQCSYCEQSIEYFCSNRPCFHWLLNPNGFKKKHFPLLYKNYGFHQIESYLRWVANTETPVRNINDLTSEKNPAKLIEETIKYKKMEWSFSCSQGDYDGHEDKHDGQMPHFHFQMKSDGYVLINYGGFHVPFNEYDHFVFAIKHGNIDKLKYDYSYGAGVQSLMERLTPEALLNGMKNSPKDIEDGEFHLSTSIEADPGTTISGDEIADLIKESKETGIPLAKLVRKLKNVKIVTLIIPGPAIPKIAGRKPRKSSNQNNSKLD